MVDVMDLPKSRVNASMLAQFIDRPVCFVGRLEKVRVLTTSVPRSVVGGRDLMTSMVVASRWVTES